MTGLVDRLLAASRDERLSTGMLYREAADRIEHLHAEIVTLQKLVAEAADDIEDWGLYASEYFQQKHDLAGNVAKYRKAITASGDRAVD